MQKNKRGICTKVVPIKIQEIVPESKAKYMSGVEKLIVYDLCEGYLDVCGNCAARQFLFGF